MIKEYLGDGAYAQYDGYSIHLTAENGIRAIDTIVLEPEVLIALLRFTRHNGAPALVAAAVKALGPAAEPR